MSEVQTTTDKEDSPFGPWLLVSYGKQVSRNYKGKSWKAGNGNANFVARNGIAKNGPENNIRSGLDSNSRKMDGEFTEDSAGVLRDLHKGVQEFETQCMTVDDSCLMQDSLNELAMQMDNSFDEIAANLQEAMVVIAK
ncbi:hypothetical protein Q3G72_004439 [Acer saccharum]|nr:hypothetical protein Q3G72_004439 [Acer saccharum]